MKKGKSQYLRIIRLLYSKYRKKLKQMNLFKQKQKNLRLKICYIGHNPRKKTEILKILNSMKTQEKIFKRPWTRFRNNQYTKNSFPQIPKITNLICIKKCQHLPKKIQGEK